MGSHYLPTPCLAYVKQGFYFNFWDRAELLTIYLYTILSKYKNMKDKININLVVVASIIAIVVGALIIAVNPGGITGAVVVDEVPDEQCNILAGNLNKAVQNVAVQYSSGTGTSPCGAANVDYISYMDEHGGGFTRTAYANGDARGHIMMTSYVLCNDGRARVYSRLGAYYYNRGKHAWGLWLFNPHKKNAYKIEKCNTLD